MTDPQVEGAAACPFCGGQSISWRDDGFRWGRLGCDECGAEGPEVRIQTIGIMRADALDEARPRARDEWNGRKP